MSLRERNMHPPGENVHKTSTAFAKTFLILIVLPNSIESRAGWKRQWIAESRKMEPGGLVRFLTLALSLAGLLSAAEIPQGTHLLLRMVNSVSTRTARVGDRVYMRTASPVLVNGQFVIPTESYAEGVVTHSERSGRVKGRAELGIRVESITLASGKTIRVAPRLQSVDSDGTTQKVDDKEHEVKQGGTKGRDAERIAVIGAEGAAIGGLADRGWKGAGIGAGIGGAVGVAATMLTRGREVDLRAGSTFDVVFDRAVPVD